MKTKRKPVAKKKRASQKKRRKLWEMDFEVSLLVEDRAAFVKAMVAYLNENSTLFKFESKSWRYEP